MTSVAASIRSRCGRDGGTAKWDWAEWRPRHAGGAPGGGVDGGAGRDLRGGGSAAGAGAMGRAGRGRRCWEAERRMFTIRRRWNADVLGGRGSRQLTTRCRRWWATRRFSGFGACFDIPKHRAAGQPRGAVAFEASDKRSMARVSLPAVGRPGGGTGESYPEGSGDCHLMAIQGAVPLYKVTAVVRARRMDAAKAPSGSEAGSCRQATARLDPPAAAGCILCGAGAYER